MWPDISKHDNDGVCIGARWEEDSMEFDGVDDRANCGNHTSFDMTEEMSFEVLLKMEDPGHYPCIVCKKIPAGNSSYYFQFVTYTRKIAIFISGVTPGWEGANTAVPLHTWTHLVGVWNGSDVRYYFNGLPDGVILNRTGTARVTPNNLYVGARDNADYPFDGKIALMRIFNKALTAEQIREAYEQSYRLI